MNNNRDCEHGRRNGNCDTCELAEAKQSILELRAQVEQYQKLFNESPDLTFDDCLHLFADEIAEVRAQAVEDAAKHLCQLITSPPSLHTQSSGALFKYANQLRSNKI